MRKLALWVFKQLFLTVTKNENETLDIVVTYFFKNATFVLANI